MRREMLGDKKLRRYNEGLFEIVNKKYSSEQEAKSEAQESVNQDGQKTEEQIEKEIHQALIRLFSDDLIYELGQSYRRPIQFAHGNAPDDRYFRGYTCLEINPEHGFHIVIRELDFMADRGDESHLSKYALKIKDDKVFFFSTNENKEFDAAKTLRHSGVFSCNVDRSKMQTAESIMGSLEKALKELAP